MPPMMQGIETPVAQTVLRILLIEDDEDDYLLVRDYLSEIGQVPPEIEWAATYEAGRSALARRAHDIVLVDYRLGARNGLDLLVAARAAGDLPPAIVMTGAGDTAVDMAAQAAGAVDYLIKGQLNAATLERTIRYTLDQARQRVALANSQLFLQDILDTLSAEIAVLDAQGVIVAVNAAWRRFGAEHGFPGAGYGVGMDYLAVCDMGAQADAAGAAEVGAAIRDIIAGRRTSFVREDPCHGPDQRRWFTIRISRFPGEGPTRLVLALEDVTDRHLAEERTRLQAHLLDQVPAAVIATDLTGTVTHWNAHATTLYGWTPDEIVSRPSSSLLISPTDSGLAQSILERVTAGETWAGEFPVQRKDGTSLPVFVTESVIHDERGRPTGIVGISVDITERKRAEEAILASERSYRELLEQAADAILIIGPDGRLLTVNARACVLSGYEREELLTLRVADIMPPEEEGEIALRVAELDKGPRTSERLIRRKDGMLLPTEVSAARLSDGRVQIIARDITERQAAAVALRQGAESFASLFEATGDGIIIMEEGRIVTVNLAYAALLGYEPNELIGCWALDFVAPADRTIAAAKLSAGYDQPYEVFLQRKDGSLLATEVTGRSIRYQDRPARLTSVRDITERKRVADALRADAARRQALIETQHAVAAATFDHDALLQIVVGHAQVLTGADGATIELLEGEEVVTHATSGRAKSAMGLRLPLTESLSGYCVLTGKAQWSRDTMTDARVNQSIRAENGIRSLLLVPLLYEGRTFGVLKVIAGRPASFAETDLETLELLGGVSAAALSHAAAYEQQRALTETLRLSEAGLAAAQRAVHLGNWEYDYAEGGLHWSDEIFRIGGFAPQSFVPSPGRLLAAIHPDDREMVRQALTALEQMETAYEFDHRIVRTDGEVRIVHQQAEVIRDATGRPLKRLGIVQDVTEQRALEQQLRHQAFHDALTGLPNRALFFERLDRALAHLRRDEQPCAVLFLDLDRFKDINDTVGHDAGDRLLQAVALRLGSVLRDGDTLARLGGDEFTVLLENVADVYEAMRAATRLLDTLTEAFVLDRQEYRFTASIGIAMGQGQHERPEDVLRDADIAMYRAKEAGRAGYAIFDPEMQAQLIARLALERDLRHALEHGEFMLHYQPIVNLHSGDMTKVEALVRWYHPTRGLISPDAFIPLAEETGLIRPLGRWVLGEACRQARSWQLMGTPMAISVNLTAQEFQHPGLADEVAAALAAAEMEPRWLRLEITESLAMHDVTATIATLTALQELGVTVAIDDFGTGYSSLAYLKRLPVSVLKIDKAFVDGLGIEEEDTAIVTAIITLAHTLGLRVIAEGVETADQADRLHALGCDQAQGYYFARPLAAAAIEPLLPRFEVVQPPRPVTGKLSLRRTAPLPPLLPTIKDAASG